MKISIDKFHLIRFGGLALTLLATACTDKDAYISNSLLRVSAEEAGEHCTDGGQKIEVGQDKDSNGELSSEEVSTTAYVCKDAMAQGATVTTTELAAGDRHCAKGGYALTTGVDGNADGTLDKNESMTRYLCNGASGEPGADGPVGPSGANGIDGVDGVPGVDGAKGADGATGDKGDTGAKGDKGDTGAQGDTGAIGEKGPQGDTGSQGEVGPQGPIGETGLPGETGPKGETGAQGEQGEPGTSGTNGLNSLIKVTAETAGSNCAEGGLKVESGLDSDADTVLDASEVQSTSYLCTPSQKTGESASRAGSSCKQILDDGFSVGNGLYYIDPQKLGQAKAFQVQCDMTTDGGGFTLAVVQAVGINWACLTSSTAPTALTTPSSTVLSYLDFAAMGADEMYVWETGGSRVLKFYYPRTGVSFTSNYRHFTERGCFNVGHTQYDAPHTGGGRDGNGHFDDACSTGNYAGWKARTDCRRDSTNSYPAWGDGPGQSTTYNAGSDCWFYGGTDMSSVPTLSTCPTGSRASFASYTTGTLSGAIQLWVR